MRVLVTGGAGFIGANSCRELLARPGSSEVVALDDLSTGAAANLDGPGRAGRRLASWTGSCCPQWSAGPTRSSTWPRGPPSSVAGRPGGQPRGQRHRHRCVLEACRGPVPMWWPPRRPRSTDRSPSCPSTRTCHPADEPVRGQQAGGRGVRCSPTGRLRAAGAGAALLQRLRAAAAGRARLRRGDPGLRRRRAARRAAARPRRRRQTRDFTYVGTVAGF